MCVNCSVVLTLCDPMDCGLPGSSVHGILWQEYWSVLPFPSPILEYAAAAVAKSLFLQPCSSHTLAAGWSTHGGSLRIRLSKYQWIFIVNPGLDP